MLKLSVISPSLTMPQCLLIATVKIENITVSSVAVSYSKAVTFTSRTFSLKIALTSVYVIFSAVKSTYSATLRTIYNASRMSETGSWPSSDGIV